MVPSNGNWGLGKERRPGLLPRCRAVSASTPCFSHSAPGILFTVLRGSPLSVCPEAAVLTSSSCPFAMHSDIHSPGLAHRLGLSVPLRTQSGPEFPGQGCLVPESSEEGWWVDRYLGGGSGQVRSLDCRRDLGAGWRRQKEGGKVTGCPVLLPGRSPCPG